jgi:hypothetical protein
VAEAAVDGESEGCQVMSRAFESRRSKLLNYLILHAVSKP